jgi:hypothetical protein
VSSGNRCKTLVASQEARLGSAQLRVTGWLTLSWWHIAEDAEHLLHQVFTCNGKCMAFVFRVSPRRMSPLLPSQDGTLRRNVSSSSASKAGIPEMSKVLPAMLLKSQVVWNVTSCVVSTGK